MFREKWASLIPGFHMPPKGSKRTLPADAGTGAKSKAKVTYKAPPDDGASLKRSLPKANVACKAKGKAKGKAKATAKAVPKAKATAKAVPKARAAGRDAEETQAGA